MLTLASKLKRDDGLRGSRTSAAASDSTRRVSVRDRLLVKGTVCVRCPPVSRRGLAGGFWDAEWPVAGQRHLLENVLRRNASCLQREDFVLCAGRGDARGGSVRFLPARCLSLSRVSVGARPRERRPVTGLRAGWRGPGFFVSPALPSTGGRPVKEGIGIR